MLYLNRTIYFMNNNEHIYNTRSKMINNISSNKKDTTLGISKAIKVYNIKNRTLTYNTPDLHNTYDTTNDNVYNIYNKIEDEKKSLNPFSLNELFIKIKNFSNDIDTDVETDIETETDAETNFKTKKIFKNKYKQKDERKFFETLDVEDKKLYKSLEESIKQYRSTSIPLRFKILKLDIPIYTKNYIIEKIDQFSKLDTNDNEYHKLNTWLNNLIKIPFCNYITPEIYTSSSSEDIAKYLTTAQDILEKEVYGHKDAKEQIIEIIASQITNPDLLGVAIGIKGPPGNGKTTLIKNGISKALGRPFRLIGLGGSSSSDFLVGHDYTYEGSVPGKIVQILQETKCMNPIIYFDELDKVSDTPKGQEIINLLCHLVDTSQNQHYSDKYFSGIDFDMSRVLFVFSYNDDSVISPILLDRLIKIKTNKFNKDDKIKIATDYLIPNICTNINFKPSNISFTKECLEYIISNHTKNEAGVRNFKRFLEKVVSRINIINLLKDYSGDIKEIIPYAIKDFQLPIEITKDIVEKLIKINTDEEDMDPAIFGLYT